MQNVFKVNNKNPRTTSLTYVKRRWQGRLMTNTSPMIEVPIIEWLEFNASTLIKYLLPHKSFSIAHCVKSVQIRSYFWSVFSCIWIEYVNLRIQSEYRKIWTRNNCVFGHFSRSVYLIQFSCICCLLKFCSCILQFVQNSSSK